MLSGICHSDTPDPKVIKSDAPEIPSNKTIKKVNVRIHPIFDESNPKENNFLFRLANKLHINTDIDVIKNDLLFSENSPYDENLLYESERILRTRRYLNSASVTLDSENEEGVEVGVDVNEVWTLVPKLGFSRSGGENDYSVGFKDSNFLGYGKSFEISYNKSAERQGELFEYYDPNTGWYQTRLGLAYENNSDGSREYFSFIRPYFSLETPKAGGVSYEKHDRQEGYYDKGRQVDSYRHLSKKTEMFYGFRLSKSDRNYIYRWNIGYTEYKDNFFTLESEPVIIAPPSDREFNIIWTEHHYIQNQYSRYENIDQINRVEDINLGWQSQLRLGYVDSPYPEYDGSAYSQGWVAKGIVLGKNSLLKLSSQISGFYKSGEIYNGVTHADIDYHWKNFKHGQFFVGLKGSRGLRLFSDRSLSAGGGYGLRAYPDQYQAGDKRYLASIEQRFYGQRECLSLFYMGYVLFYDHGRAWGNSASPQTQDGTLRDIGFGLRFSGTRNGSREEGAHNVLHIDFASPLDGDDDLSSVEVSIRVRRSF